MANLSPELVKFHAVLGPKWHAAPGPERMTGACTAIADFTVGADAVAKAPAPAKSHTAMWAQETKELVDAVAGMKAKCSAHDTASFEAAFASVHAGFHKLLEAASGEGEHGEAHGEEKHEGGGY